MMRRLAAAPRSHLLGLIALGLVVLGIWPWFVQNEPVPARPPATTAVAAPAVPVLPPLAHFASVVERPLFSPSRRPDNSTPTTPAAGNVAGRYRLIGIVSEADVRHAWVVENGRRFEIAEGDNLTSVHVGRIEADRVVLLSPDGETILRLRPVPSEPAKTAEPPRR